MDRKTSTITLRKETIGRLREFGRFNESYEDVVNRLVNQAVKLKEGNTGRHAATRPRPPAVPSSTAVQVDV